ncbi:MAG: uncharacterized protein JWN44_269 [Myxococcales bacterium]|nr:uncharacterized protein [Myxococcales bacterium]
MRAVGCARSGAISAAMAAAMAVGTALAGSGCYNPSPPAGSYRCGTADRECPSGQHCTCGLCVKSDDQAACAFGVDSSAATTVNEHEAFAVTITAYRDVTMTSPATKFNGTVSLSASWGDVNPPTVELVDGQAVAMVSLNRETLPPQTAKVTATFAGNKGTSGKIAVKAPPFVRDPVAVVPPPTAMATFGFADAIVAEPAVIVTSTGEYRMYFGGYANGAQFKGYNFGFATSTDGVHFTPNPVPVLRAPPMPDKAQINSPSVFNVGTSWYLAYAQGTSGVIDQQDAYLAGPSVDGMAAFPVSGPVVRRTDCAYCDATVDFPSVIPDPAGNGYIMFFSAGHKIGTGTIAEVGRASSPDGLTWVAEPAPLLSSDITGELVLLAPRVYVDGTVFKMWYSYARGQDIMDLQNLCNDMNRVQIGYATSSDGFYWIRSPSNPAVAVGGTGWDADSRALLPGSVVPRDGKSPNSGFAIYYTTFRAVSILGICLPNGIGRATRP